MLDEKTEIPQPAQPLLPGETTHTPRQRRLMFAALLLLLVSLTAVLYRDRAFWFPDTEQGDDQLLSTPPGQDSQAQDSQAQATQAQNTQTQQALVPVNVPAKAVVPEAQKPQKKKKRRKPLVALETKPEVSSDPVKADVAAAAAPSAGPTVTATRTVLPPLEVEVVAGDAHRTVRPGSNAVHVELQRPASGQSYSSIPDETTETAARVAAPATQRASISTDPAPSVVSHSVRPDYPMLARQMRVQGSVILQALIGRDGLIQDLRILSGPPILATAAEEAVRQWHFKPHLVGSEPVETRANITVNFTISTN